MRLAAGLAIQARRPAMLALLQPASLQDTVRLRAAMATLQPQIAARTAAVRSDLVRIVRLERGVASAGQRRRVLLARLAAQRNRLTTLAASERLRAARAAGSADREAERAAVLAGRTRTPTDLAEALAPHASGARPAALPVAYRLPVRSSRGRIGSDGALRLPSTPGAPVTTPAAGRIAFAGPFRGFGTIVIVEHAGGWTSLVTGLGRIDVAAGQRVLADASIGRAAGPIGLELRRDGTRVPLTALLR